MADMSDDMLMVAFAELREQNGGRRPSVKQLEELTGLPTKEVKTLLAELLEAEAENPKPKKKQKTAQVPPPPAAEELPTELPASASAAEAEKPPVAPLTPVPAAQKCGDLSRAATRPYMETPVEPTQVVSPEPPAMLRRKSSQLSGAQM